MATEEKINMLLIECTGTGVFLLNEDIDEEVYASFEELRKILRDPQYKVEGVKINSEGTLLYSSGDVMDY